jgi:hypothetical protein
MISQSRNYTVTLNPYATAAPFLSFDVDASIPYNRYLSIIRENVFVGMREALFSGTAARLGSMLKDGAPYYYYAKTGTTGNDEVKRTALLLQENGFDIRAVLYPTVPLNKERLRIVLHAFNTENEVEQLIKILS